jgi:glutamine amidotransferase
MPVLGICLGMEMFFEKSEEGKEHGLSVIDGEVILLPNTMKVPHMGWNSLEIELQNNFLEGVNDGSWVYFVHSYMIKTKETGLIAANADYGIKVPAVIQQKNFIGTQFHPEKSGKIGSLMLSNFLSECKK